MNSPSLNRVVPLIFGVRVCSVVVLGIALFGCATPPLRTLPPAATGDASWRAVVPPGTERYALAIGDVSSGASSSHRVTPVYPPSLLAACPAPVEVEALLIVDQTGTVGEVRVSDEVAASPERRQFVDAVRAAARQWQFEPLQITHWTADDSGNTHRVSTQTKPFSLTYVFRFECHAGKVSVRSNAAGH